MTGTHDTDARGAIHYDFSAGRNRKRAATAHASQASYDISRTEQGWRVTLGIFAWDFATWPEACDHAFETARLYATVSGKCTGVRVRESTGDFLEVRRYAGVVRLPTATRRFAPVSERRA